MGTKLFTKANWQDRYRASDWHSKRKQILERDNYECRTCRETERLEVHHNQYSNLGDEPEEDLITLCHWCHEAVTSSIRERRYAKRKKQPEILENKSNITRKEQNYDFSNTQNETHRNQSNSSSQRSYSRPSRLLLQSYETGIEQTVKDRR